MKDWENIADNLHKAGWSLGWVSALDLEGRTIWIVDVHRDEGKRFAVRADEKLTAFRELECSTQRASRSGSYRPLYFKTRSRISRRNALRSVSLSAFNPFKPAISATVLA